nr:1-acyl-sn-glycerol-3-phosphate acyltransferase [Oscillospiraceae bacterium]
MSLSELTMIILVILVVVGFVARPSLLFGIFGISMTVASAVELFTDAPLWMCLLCLAGSVVVLFGLAFVFLVLVCHAVDLDKPQENDSKFYRTVMHWYIAALIPLVRLEIRTRGLEKTPKEGRFLLVCNHQNESDPGILLHYFKSSQLAFISKRENKTMFAVGKFMHKTLCQLVNRENDREALKTILKCIQLIKEDKVSIGAFPEGGILVKDKLSHFRSGMFKIAQKANVPIVVCTLKGTSDLFHNLKRLKKTYVELHLVDVIPAESLKGRTTVEIAEQVHAMMLSDLGESYRLEQA